MWTDRVAAEVPRPFSVCFEASCGYGYLHERLSALAERVAVAHPGKLRLIFRARRKNDRVDRPRPAPRPVLRYRLVGFGVGERDQHLRRRVSCIEPVHSQPRQRRG